MIRRIVGNLTFLVVLAAVMASSAGLIAVISQAQQLESRQAEVKLLRGQLAQSDKDMAEAARQRDQLLAGQEEQAAKYDALLRYLASQGITVPESVLQPSVTIRNESRDSGDSDNSDDSRSPSSLPAPKPTPKKVQPPPKSGGQPSDDKPGNGNGRGHDKADHGNGTGGGKDRAGRSRKDK